MVKLTIHAQDGKRIVRQRVVLPVYLFVSLRRRRSVPVNGSPTYTNEDLAFGRAEIAQKDRPSAPHAGGFETAVVPEGYSAGILCAGALTMIGQMPYTA